MRPIASLCALFVGALFCCQGLAQDGDDAKAIQGPWEIVELIVGGQKVPEKDVKGMRFVFENTSTRTPAATGPQRERRYAPSSCS